MCFPVENRNGTQGVSALSKGETTQLHFKVLNTSKLPVGKDSHSVRDQSGRKLNIDLKSGGFQREIKMLNPSKFVEINLSLECNGKKIRPCQSAGLQADIYIEALPCLSANGSIERSPTRLLAQRRIFVTSYQPKYIAGKPTDVILVTTTSTNADQVSAWESSFCDRLGLTHTLYSLSRYGHIDAQKSVEKFVLKGRLIIILNDAFIAHANVEGERYTTGRPSEFIQGVFGFDETTRFLVVGGENEVMEHISLRSASVCTIKGLEGHRDFATSEKPSRKTFKKELVEAFKQERVKGFSSSRVDPVCHVVQVKTRTFLIVEKSATTMERRSNQIKSWLNKNDKLRQYRVDGSAHEEPFLLQAGDSLDVKKGIRRKRFAIGKFRIYFGPPRCQNSLVCLEDEEQASNERSVPSTPHSIGSLTCVHSTMIAAPFPMRIKSYCHAIYSPSLK
eukprot:scaffold5612_cov150-Amphora_coffeaeformis.AAC.3